MRLVLSMGNKSIVYILRSHSAPLRRYSGLTSDLDRRLQGPANLVLNIDGIASNVQGLMVSAEVFSALGVKAVIGRTYTAEEDFGGGSTMIVLSYEFWQNRLGGREVLGTTLASASAPATVIGVMPIGACGILSSVTMIRKQMPKRAKHGAGGVRL